MADGAIKVHHGEIADLDIDGEDGAGADDHALAELDASAEMSLRMDEGEEFGASGDERGDELFLERRHTESGEIEGVGGRLVAGERMHRCEASEGGERVGIVVQETGGRPGAAAVGMLAGPDVEFAAETAGADDQEFFHESKLRMSPTVRQARTCAPVISRSCTCSQCETTRRIASESHWGKAARTVASSARASASTSARRAVSCSVRVIGEASGWGR